MLRSELNQIWLRMKALMQRRALDRDLDEELRFHLAMRERKLVAGGMEPQEAHDAALRRLGSATFWKEATRDMWTFVSLDALWQDLRFGGRMLRNNAGFAAVAILTLALGIGATTAIFSVVNTVLLRSLAYPQADQLVVLQEAIPKIVPGKMPVSGPDVPDFRRLNHSLEDMGAFSNRPMDLSGIDRPQRLLGTRISAAALRILRVAPLIGRTFTDEEDAAGHDVVVLSYALWQNLYGGDRNAIGRKMTLDRQSYTVIGVMPAGFEFPPQGMPFYTPGECWVPIAFSPSELGGRGDNFNFGVVGRLKNGVTLEQANADIMVTARQVQQQLYPSEFRSGFELEATVLQLQDMVTGSSKNLLWLLLAAVGILLLIACANVANLLVARGTERQKEMAVRVALGAPRVRLVRQLLVESALLGLLGGALGLLVAFGAMQGLVVLAQGILPRTQDVRLDPAVLGFALAVSIVCGLLFGTAPSLFVTRTDLSETLKETGRGGSVGRRRHILRDAFVVVQVALALLLVAGSGLLIRSFIRARETDPGFRPEHAVALSISLPGSQYTQVSQVQSFYDRLRIQTAALPGVISVALSTDLPTRSNWNHLFTAEGHEADQRGSVPSNAHTLVAGDYLQTLGIPLIRGRFFSEVEMKGGANVVAISEGMAKQYWRDEDPLGRRLKWGTPTTEGPWLTIVGVVGDVKQGPIDQTTMAHTYEPFAQVFNGGDAGLGRARILLVRSQTPMDDLVNGVREAMRRLDPEQPIGRVVSLGELVSNSLAPRRFNTLLLGVFGAGALVLAAIGIYGLLAYSVSQQTRDLGVRMALGAGPRDVLRLVIGQGLRLALVGIAVGLVASIALTRVMSSLLYGVTPTDPATFAGVTLLILAVALLACAVPAWRATRVDPIIALRYE